MYSVFDLLVLSQVPGIGANRLRGLVSHFGSTSSLMKAGLREIASVEGIGMRLASSVTRFLKGPGIEEAKKYADLQLSKLNRVEGRILSFWDSRYPEGLKRIYDPPAIIFMKGEILKSDRIAVAVVGTRSPSRYGAEWAEKFSCELASLGITVVSGLARGIDTIAHKASLKSWGRTIAVIGSGLDVFYPPENRSLCELIRGSGAVISECEMGSKPDATNFPRRNRIISGLSLGTLVVESDLSGGAMITAGTSLDQNREVFALPGSLNSRHSRGCHALIKSGRAKLVETVQDITDELQAQIAPRPDKSVLEKAALT